MMSRQLDLTQAPIPGLIGKIAVPASVGFFFHTMFNVADTWFAGRLVSTQAVAALSLSFPIFFIIIAMGSGIAQGSTALIANALGAGNRSQAQLYSVQAVSFGVLFSILLTSVGLAASPALFRLLGATDDYLDVSLAYMNVILCGTVFFLLQSILNASLNAMGDTRSFRDVLIAGFVLNLLLDPWFLLGGLGLPALGIRGIALATVVIQVLGSLFMLYRVRNSHLWSDLKLRHLLPRAQTFRDIATQGIPASFNMVTVALGIFVITWFISRFSAEGVAAYGIATRVEQIVLLPTIGLNIAVLTLVGQNNGAGRHDRVLETWFTTLKYGLAMMAAGGIALFFSARHLMAFFTPDERVVAIGAEYLRVASVTLCSYVVLFQTVYLLQGLKRPFYAIWIGLYRQLVAPSIVFYFLAFRLNWNLSGIWWGIFLVTWSAAIFTFFYGRRILLRTSRGQTQPSAPAS